TYVVKGVFADVPENSHVDYDVLLAMLVRERDVDDWHNSNLHTYLLLNSGQDQKSLEAKLVPYSEKYSMRSDEQSNDDYRWEIQLQPLSSIHLNSNIDFEHRVNGNIDNMYIVFLVAIMIIAISCFNYVNLSNSLYADRLREFFVRKLHGATSSSLLKQYAG